MLIRINRFCDGRMLFCDMFSETKGTIRTPTSLSPVAAFALGRSSAASEAPEPGAHESRQEIQLRNPVYPAVLNRTGIFRSFAAFAFGVDAEARRVNFQPIADRRSPIADPDEDFEVSPKPPARTRVCGKGAPRICRYNPD